MTAPDPRVGEIENRLANLKQGPWELHSFGASDVSYLLAELRKAREALGRVEALHFAVGDPDHSFADTCFECLDIHPCPTVEALRAAVAAANGDVDVDRG